MNISKISKRTLMLGAVIALSACQTTGSSGLNPNADDNDARINSALQRAAASADRSGNSGKSLRALEAIYKRNSDKESAALNYAAALRKNDYINRAAVVVEPFADAPNASSAAKSEYAAIALAQGQNEKAEKYAQKAVLENENNAEAYHYLGIALDAQGHHEEAERAFRKGLELWDGDPATIMNNLALNLAAQGFLDESATILQKARTIAPERREIERNLRIVTALQQSNGIPTPKPKKKPET